MFVKAVCVRLLRYFVNYRSTQRVVKIEYGLTLVT